MSARFWLGLCLLACSAAAAAQQAVGFVQHAWLDPTRPSWNEPGLARPLRVTLWYPAEDGAPTAVLPAGPFELDPVAPGAAPVGMPRRLPLLLLSHGTGGSALSLGWLARSLAASGYLVAGVDHHGNTGAEPQYQLPAFVSWWDRPRDLTVALDRLLADPQWGSRIDAQRIGVIGFSLGGYTALAAAGARLDPVALAQFHRQCMDSAAQCQLPPEVASGEATAALRRLLREDERLKASIGHAGDDWREPRVRAALVLAPVMGRLLDRDSVAALRLPLLLIASEADDQAPPALTAEWVARTAPNARVLLLQDATHYSFLARCTEQGRQFAAPICRDPAGHSRDDLHRRVEAQALRFLGQALAPR